MARVTGPLMSMDARGSVAKAIVFSIWNGVNYVRHWLKPANPEEAGQGDRRIILGGTGRAVGQIQAGKAFAEQLRTLGLVPAKQSKQSFLVQYILEHYILGSTTYAAELAAISDHTSKDAFDAAADALGITEFDLDYAAVAPYDKALGLYLIAKSAIALGLSGTPYTTDITAWVTADVNGMVNDFTNAD